MTSIWTRQELLEEIDLYKRALKACASGSSYTIGSRSLTRQNLQEIRAHLDYLAGELAARMAGAALCLCKAVSIAVCLAGSRHR